MEGSKKVQRYYQIGKEKFDERKYLESLNYFEKAIQLFQSPHPLYLKAAILTNMANTYKALKQFEKSSQKYQQSIQYISKAQKQLYHREVSKYPKEQIQEEKINLYQQKYHLLVSLALFKNQIADVQDIQLAQFDKYYSALKDSLKNLGIAFKMVTHNLANKYNCKYSSFNMNWEKEYMNVIVNVADALFIDALKFEDEKIFKKIVQVIQKGQQFYNLHGEQQQQKMKEIYSKGFYIKGISLMKIGQEQQGLKYLQKDYTYCKQNQKQQDMLKTRDSLVVYYVKHKKWERAKQIAGKDKRKKQQIVNTKIQTERILKQIDNIDNLLKFLDDNQENSYLISEQQLIRKLQYYAQQSQLIIRQNIKFSILYHLGRLKNKAKKYHQAYLNIKEAKKYITNKKQEFFLMMIESDSLDQIGVDKRQVEKLLKMCLQMAYELKNQQNISSCKQNLQIFYNEKKRAENPLEPNLQGNNQIIIHLKSLRPVNTHNQQNKKQKQQLDKKTQFSIQSISETYKRQCKNKSIIPRKVILDELRRNSNNSFNFGLFYNLEEQQLVILFQIVPNFIILNLINHDLSMKSAYQLSHSNKLKDTRQLSLRGLLTYQSIKNIVSKPKQLNDLVLYKSYGILDIALKKNKTSLANILVSPNALIKLTLQYSKLKDESLECINFNRLSSLQQLSLKGNQIEGQGLKNLSELNFLLLLNLSENPLKNYPINKPSLMNLKLCGLKQGLFYFQQYQQNFKNTSLFQQLSTIQQLDLSYNYSMVVQRILQGFCDYCTQKLDKIETLKKIYLHGITLTVETSTAIKRTMIVCTQLKEIIGKQMFGSNVDILSLQTFSKDQNAFLDTPNFINDQELGIEKLF